MTRALATTQAWARPSALQLDNLVRRADQARQNIRVLVRALDDAERVVGGNYGRGADEIAALRSVIVAWRRDGLVAKTASLLAALNAAEPPGFYDDEGNISRPRVAAEIAQMLGAFPTNNVTDPRIFTGTMIEEVMALEPDWMSLVAACRDLLKTKTFVPAIAEVVEAVETQKAKWASRWEALDVDAEWLDAIEADCNRMEAVLENRAQPKPKVVPPVAGDWVEHKGLGRGVVLELDERRALVMFETVGERRVVLSFLSAASPPPEPLSLGHALTTPAIVDTERRVRETVR